MPDDLAVRRLDVRIEFPATIFAITTAEQAVGTIGSRFDESTSHATAGCGSSPVSQMLALALAVASAYGGNTPSSQFVPTAVQSGE